MEDCLGRKSAAYLKSVKGRLCIFFLISVVFLGLSIAGISLNSAMLIWTQTNSPSTDTDPLEDALREVSMGNNTVIITTINKAYTANNSMLDLFIYGLRQGIGTEQFIEQILFAAFDGEAFNQCQARGLHCYNVNTADSDFSQDEVFMSPGFLKMMWRRTLFLTDVLSRGYDILFTDVDILWLQNPFHRLSPLDDVQISCDWYHGGPNDESNRINAGFFFVRSNNKTIELFDVLCKSRNVFKFLNEQDMLQLFMKTGVIRHLGLKFRALSTQQFSGFCGKSNNLTEVTTVHANCIKGSGAKMQTLRSYLAEWKSFMAKMNQTNSTVSTGMVSEKKEN